MFVGSFDRGVTRGRAAGQAFPLDVAIDPICLDWIRRVAMCWTGLVTCRFSLGMDRCLWSAPA